MNAACPSPLRRMGSPLSISLRMTPGPDSPHNAAPASLGGQVPGTRIARPGRKSGRRESPSAPSPLMGNCTPGSSPTAPRSSIAWTARPGCGEWAPLRSGGSIRSGRCAMRPRRRRGTGRARRPRRRYKPASRRGPRRPPRNAGRIAMPSARGAVRSPGRRRRPVTAGTEGSPIPHRLSTAPRGVPMVHGEQEIRPHRGVLPLRLTVPAAGESGGGWTQSLLLARPNPLSPCENDSRRP